MDESNEFRRQYDRCLIDQPLFDGYTVSCWEYAEISADPGITLRSAREMQVDEFVCAHRCMVQDIVSSLYVPVPQDSTTYGECVRQDDATLEQVQRERRYSWAGFFSEYLHEEFQKIADEDVSWRDATDLTARQIFQAKRAKLESVKSRDRVAKAAKCAAYLTIAALAHRDEPAAS